MPTKIKSNNITTGSITADLLSATAITDKLGYTPANAAASGFDTWARDSANSASLYANTGINNAASASLYANSGITLAQAAYNQGNSTATVANTGVNNAASASTYANTGVNNAASASTYANTGVNNAASASLYANSGITLAQAAYNQGNSTATVANTKFNSSGGTISGAVTISGNNDLTVTGNLYVQGNTISIESSTLTVNDSVIVLATGNYTTDTRDIGIVGHYNNGTNAHSGVLRDSGTKEWYIFEGYTPELTSNNNIDINNASFATSNVNANYFKGNVIAGGVNLGTHVQSAFNQANTGVNNAASASLYANTGITNAASAQASACTAQNDVASASLYANTGINNAASASLYANTDYTTISVTASTYGNTTYIPVITLTANGRVSSISNTALTVPNVNTQVLSLGVGTAASGTTGEIRAANNVTAYYSSDRKFKENVQNIPDALSKVESIGGKTFDWTDDYIKDHGGEDGYFIQKEDFGVIAQDVQAVFPQAVRTRPDGSLAVDYSKLAALAFAAIVELSEKVKQLENK